ncbi:hypothetical protein ACFFL1_16105 [Samsonia erythrinae]|uniref:Acid stress chaperone HdeA n=1 Tax=Samsonia erythrinae TaxID=160434 RepID=A0A4V2VTC4_9GAMM|nr:hypothetical protein [Samsonia erythrinae]TCV05945.1 hypothetical protein EDC54_105216 [Samsonia erythrinae]
MKKVILASTLVLPFISGSAFAESNAIEQCAKLLPEDGKKYNVSLSVDITVDRTAQSELNISDETKKPLSEDERVKTKPFVECIKNILK